MRLDKRWILFSEMTIWCRQLQLAPNAEGCSFSLCEWGIEIGYLAGVGYFYLRSEHLCVS